MVEETSLSTTSPATLDPDTLSKLDSYEDYLSYYIQLNQATDTVSWVKADLLLYMLEHLGQKSIEALSMDIKQPLSTVTNYIRTARAFPPEKRDAGVSFSHHFQASFADPYDDKSGKFLSENRFEWIHKAADGGLSTRRLQAQIHEEKEKISLGAPVIPCTHCGRETGEIRQWVLYSPSSRMRARRFYLHESCVLKILDYIHVDQKPAE